jgi:type II secretory pathway pseudopilin PulG
MRPEYGALVGIAIVAIVAAVAVLSRSRARRARALAEVASSLATLADADLSALSRALDALAQGNLEASLALRAGHLNGSARDLGEVAAAHDVLVDHVAAVLARFNAVGGKLNGLVTDMAATSMLLSNVGAEASLSPTQAALEAGRIKEAIKDVAG